MQTHPADSITFTASTAAREHHNQCRHTTGIVANSKRTRLCRVSHVVQGFFRNTHKCDFGGEQRRSEPLRVQRP